MKFALAPDSSELNRRELVCIELARQACIASGMPLRPTFAPTRRWWQWPRDRHDQYPRPLEKSVEALSAVYAPYPTPELLIKMVGVLYGPDAAHFVEMLYGNMANCLEIQRNAMENLESGESEICVSRAHPSQVIFRKIADFPPYGFGVQIDAVG